MRDPQKKSALLVLAAAAFALFPLPVWAAENSPKAKKKVAFAGKVVDVETGRPVPEIEFMLQKQLPVSEETVREIVKTDGEGRFRLELDSGTEVALYWRFSPGTKPLLDIRWLSSENKMAVYLGRIDSDKKDVVLEVKLLQTYELAGKVTGPDGKPVANASLYVNNFIMPAKTDQEGKFVIKTMPKGKNMQIFVLGGEEGTLAKLVKVESEVEELSIVLEPTFSVKGKAVDEEGKPAPGLLFQVLPFVNEEMLFRVGMQVSNNVKTSPDGTFELKRLCRGVKYLATWYANSQYNSDYERGQEVLSIEQEKEVVLKVKRFHDDWKSPGNICVSEETRCRSLTNYCLDENDNFLVCDGGRNRVMVISPKDKLLATWKLGFGPQAIACREDGTAVVSGNGRIAVLDKKGKILHEAELKGETTTDVGACGKDVFVSVRRRTGYAIYRLDEKLESQKLIIKNLRGCCGQLDFAVRDGIIYVAANTRFRVIKYDRNGKKLGSFGERHRKKDDNGFNGCCEPKNVCFDREGYVYTAESDGRCVKKFTPKGEFVEYMGTCNGIRGCVRVTVAVNKTRDKIYMLDTGRNIIRVVKKKSVAKTASR